MLHWSSVEEQRASNRILEDGATTQALSRTRHAAEYIPTCYVGSCMMPTRLKLAPGCKHIAKQVVLLWGQLREQVGGTTSVPAPSIQAHPQLEAIQEVDVEGYGTSQHRTDSSFILAVLILELETIR